jgi:ATP-dependent DNA helicase RecQ
VRASRSDAFDLDLNELGDRHDLRPLVLRTALTHLELLGVIRQGTPLYATHQVKTLVPLDDIVGRFQGERASFVRGIFERSKQGRIWTQVVVDEVAEALRADRGRILRALDWLEEQGLIEVMPKDVRHRYTRTSTDKTSAELTDELYARFADHEAREIERVRQVLALVTASSCQTNVLVGHFGEERASPCGHCTFSATKKALVLPPPSPAPAFGLLVDGGRMRALVEKNARALGHPRQQARFLCGLSSPALSRAKLTKDALFGALAACRFHDVLAWREAA